MKRETGKMFALALLLVALGVAAACTNKTANSNGAAGATNATAPGADGPAGSTPTATVRAYHDALIKKDGAAIKGMLTKDMIRILEENAKAMKISTDEAIKQTLTGAEAPPATFETRNEKINGNDATVEIKNEKTGAWDAVPLVKEESGWKIAFEKKGA
jgi:hypothetical protein